MQQPFQIKGWALSLSQSKYGGFRFEPHHNAKLGFFYVQRQVKSWLTHLFFSSTMRFDGPRTFPARIQETDVTFQFDSETTPSAKFSHAKNQGR